MNFPLVPEQASSMSGQVDILFYFLVALTLGVLAVVFVPMFSFLYLYRQGSPADRTPPNIKSWKVEVAWTAIPLVIVTGIFFWGALLYMRLKVPPPEKDALEVNIIGKQWMWNVQHPEGKRELNALHVPLGRTVRLQMTSQDVIHDFYVPAFRMKEDVVPGRYTTQWFKATKLGSFHLFCSKLCGMGHAQMVGWVTVMTPSDYQAWLNQGGAQASLVARGERLFRTLGCSGCHGENSQIRAPSLHGLYGHPVPLDTGEIVTADDRYIHDSILLPQKQIVASYAPIMPTYQGQIDEAEVFQLIQYIKSMANDTPDEYLRQNEQVAGQTQPHVPTTQQLPAGATPGPTAAPVPAAPTPVATPTPPFPNQPTSP
jgi:cytochrome c oxidase subunit 2